MSKTSTNLVILRQTLDKLLDKLHLIYDLKQ